VSLLCLLILAIPFYSSTNNTSWIDYYYQDDVNTMDALIMSIQLVLVGFVLHMVGSVYVAMLLAQTCSSWRTVHQTWLQEANLQHGWMQ
jgi:hypothetical protein